RGGALDRYISIRGHTLIRSRVRDRPERRLNHCRLLLLLLIERIVLTGKWRKTRKRLNPNRRRRHRPERSLHGLHLWWYEWWIVLHKARFQWLGRGCERGNLRVRSGNSLRLRTSSNDNALPANQHVVERLSLENLSHGLIDVKSRKADTYIAVGKLA